MKVSHFTAGLFAGLLFVCANVSASAQKESVKDVLDRRPPVLSADALRRMESQLHEAKTTYEANPWNANALIWYGRRLGYLGRFRDAIDVFSDGIRKFPNDARMYRHRGHRYITIRKFDSAVVDFNRAASLIRNKPDEVEPDGQPNERNIPTSTLHFNIWYHLGLAHYLLGNNSQALRSYRECMKVSKNPDAVVATTHWLYMTLRRLNRNREAAIVVRPITEKMDVIENQGYHRLVLMYKGFISPETLEREALAQNSSPASHSILYGVGNWYLYSGKRARAIGVFQRMLKSDQWASFGFIAAEADLRRTI